jgi:hypothetical protein
MLFHRSIIAALVLIVVLPACRKDHIMDLPGGTGDCIPTPAPGSLLGWNFIVPQHVVNGPRFNPNDGDEIVFVERPYGSQTEFRLWRYRFSSNTLEQVLSGSNLVNMHYPVDWGSNDWFLLNLRSSGGAENIFKIRSNGDSLTQLTFTSMNFNPHWSPEGIAFGYQHQSGITYPIIMDLGTNATDTVPGSFATTCWYAPTSTIFLSGGIWSWHIGSEPSKICDLPTDLYAWGDQGSGVVVLDDQTTVLWMQSGGLYQTNLQTGLSVRLFSTCNSRYYVGLDYSPHTKKLVTTRITRTPVSENDLQIGIDIMLMNPDGTDQQVLNIPFPE